MIFVDKSGGERVTLSEGELLLETNFCGLGRCVIPPIPLQVGPSYWGQQ